MGIAATSAWASANDTGVRLHGLRIDCTTTPSNGNASTRVAFAAIWLAVDMSQPYWINSGRPGPTGTDVVVGGSVVVEARVVVVGRIVVVVETADVVVRATVVVVVPTVVVGPSVVVVDVDVGTARHGDGTDTDMVTPLEEPLPAHRVAPKKLSKETVCVCGPM